MSLSVDTSYKIEFVRFWRNISCEIKISRENIFKLIEYAEMHYDGTCKSLARQGGFLYGWKNKIDYGEDTNFLTTEVSFRECDLLTKVCENNDIMLGGQFAKLCVSMQEESVRLNQTYYEWGEIENRYWDKPC